MPRFGELEAAIMEAVWAAGGPVAVRDVADPLKRDRGSAFNTVQTVMEILFRKGWLEREKRGRAYRYWAAASREDYTAALMGEALETAADRAAALVRFAADMTPDEAAELRRALDQAREG